MTGAARSLLGDGRDGPNAQLLDGSRLVAEEDVRRVRLPEGRKELDPRLVPHGPCDLAGEDHVGRERDLNGVAGRKTLDSIDAETGRGKIDDPHALTNTPAFEDRSKADPLPRIPSAQEIS